MATVDERIVSMKFENSQFESGARTSMGTLARLKESMSFSSIAGGTVRALGMIDSAISKIGLRMPFSPFVRAANTALSSVGSVLDKLGMKNPFERSAKGAVDLQTAAADAGGAAGMGVLEGGVTAVSGKFVALSTIAITALSNITNKAINAGTNLVKSLTISPVAAGFSEYELKMDSIQTILANTARYGTKLPQVTSALDELNKYADKTIYNFGDMTKNIGLFTNSGMRVEEATSVIKGFSNSAAASGTSAQGAAGAAYQLSQAMSAGVIRLMDWRSLTNVGMGNANMRDGILDIAQAMGTLEKTGTDAKLVQKDFNRSLESGWLTADVMSNYLQIMAGDMTVAQQKTLGLSDAQVKEFAKTQKTAEEAATEVRTFSKLMDSLKEAVGSSWAQTFDILLGDFNEATKLFTRINDVVGGMFGAAGDRRAKLLGDWDELGGREKLINALGTAFNALKKVIGAVSEAFRDVFPRQTAEGLMELTESFAEFTSKLTPGAKTLERVGDIARGIFSVFSIVVTVLKAASGAIFGLLSTASSNSGGFLDFLASIGNAITDFDQFLKKSGLVESFFKGLVGVLSVPIALISGIGKALASIFEGIGKGLNFAAFKGLGDELSGVQSTGEKLKTFFGSLGDFFSKIGTKIGNGIVSIGEAIAGLFTPENFDRGLETFQTGLFAALILVIKNVFSRDVNIDITGGLFDGIKQTLGEATSALQNMQTSLKADILIKIAVAIGILALSLLVLSSIDPKALAKALAAMSGGFAVLITSMMTMMKLLGPAGIVAMYSVSTMMTKVAISMLILAVAIKVLSSIKFGEIVRGLVVLWASLQILSKAMLTMGPSAAGMTKAAFAMILMGVAINLIAVAMKIFATMSWEEIAKGMAGMAGALAALVLAMRLMPKDMSTEAVTLVALGAAIVILAVAVKIFSTMNWDEIARGLVALAGTLAIVAGALYLMPKKMLLQAVALNAVASAIVVLAGALKILGSMSWEAIEKGLIALGISMLMMALGLQAMQKTILGAAALVIAANALAVLIPVLVILGNLPIGVIITGLVALAATFVILGVAGSILAPVVLVIIGLAAALLLIGASVALVGAGLWLMAAAFATVVAAASMGMAVFAGIVQNVVLAIPKIAGAMAQGLLVFIASVAMAAPQIGLAFAKIVNAVLDQLILMVPKVGRLFSTVIATAINVLVDAIPRFVTAGYRIIAGVLKGLNDNIYQIVSSAISIIANFINGIADNIGKIVDAGFNLIIKFIEGLTNAINKNSERLGEAGVELGMAIINGVVSGLSGAGNAIKDKLMELAEGAWDSVKEFFGVASPSRLMRDTVGKPIAQGMAVGIAAAAGDVDKEMTNMGKGAMNRLGETMKNLDDAVAIDPRMQPTVSPVLDLTALSKEANKIGGLLTTRPITPRVSYSEASSLSAEISEAEREREEARERREAEPTSVTYEQHLHSPVPLDSARIYRDSRSLIALKKEELFR